MGSWYVMWWCLTHRYQHFGGTWHFHLQSWKERTLIPWSGRAAGSSKLFRFIYHTSRSHILWLYSEQTEVPITYHMAKFNIHEHQGHWTAHEISQKICSFSPHRTHCDVPPPPLWTCAAIRVYSCCVFRCHINRRIRVKIMLTSSKEIELFNT